MPGPDGCSTLPPLAVRDGEAMCNDAAIWHGFGMVLAASSPLSVDPGGPHPAVVRPFRVVYEDAQVTGAHEDAGRAQHWRLSPATRPAVCRRLRDQNPLARPSPTCRNAQQPSRSRLHGCDGYLDGFSQFGRQVDVRTFWCCRVCVRARASFGQRLCKALTRTRRRRSVGAWGLAENTVLVWSKLGALSSARGDCSDDSFSVSRRR